MWACAFNLVAVPLAAGVAYPTVSLHPAAAAAAMAGSCLVVLLNARRLSRFRGATPEQMRHELLQMEARQRSRGTASAALWASRSEESPHRNASPLLQESSSAHARPQSEEELFSLSSCCSSRSAKQTHIFNGSHSSGSSGSFKYSSLKEALPDEEDFDFNGEGGSHL